MHVVVEFGVEDWKLFGGLFGGEFVGVGFLVGLGFESELLGSGVVPETGEEDRAGVFVRGGVELDFFEGGLDAGGFAE